MAREALPLADQCIRAYDRFSRRMCRVKQVELYISMSGKQMQQIILGGYTKSGTTFLGRVMGNFEGCYSRGEMDYFRIFGGNLQKMFAEFSRNIQIVNKEVYDGQGEIQPITVNSARSMMQSVFYDMFFNGNGIPDDCAYVIEKSPRNMFHLKEAQFVFPQAPIVNIYRHPADCLKSLMRHMADHRDAQYRDPDSDLRRAFMPDFERRWNQYKAHITSDAAKKVINIRYDRLKDDLPGFVDFARSTIFKKDIALKAPLETLSKESYLASLPAKARKTSLVQEDMSGLRLSDEEIAFVRAYCHEPNIKIHFG